MTPRLLFALLVPVFGLASTVPSFAHHSQSEFDFQSSVEVAGTVTNLEWKSPHAWLFVEVTDESGELVTWEFELPSPTTLMRRGWTRKSLAPGDTVTVTGAPARNHPLIAIARTVRDAEGNGVFTGITDVN